MTNHAYSEVDMITQDYTRLESKVFSLERLYPSSPVEVSWSQTNMGSEKDYESEDILGPQKILSEIFFYKIGSKK